MQFMIPSHSSGCYFATRDLRHAVRIEVRGTVADLGLSNEQQAIILISCFSKLLAVHWLKLSFNHIAKSFMNFE
jgi:hypothetical protein